MNSELKETIIGVVTLIAITVAVVMFATSSDAATPYSTTETTDAVSFNVKADLAGRLVNEKLQYTVDYWIVTLYGLDEKGHYHGWREEVETDGTVSSFEVEQIGNQQFADKLRSGDEQAIGFMEALRGGMEGELRLIGAEQ